MQSIIKNGIIVSDGKQFSSDILIEDGKIAKIGAIENISAQIFDAKGMFVIPGGIDPHVHMELPSPAGNSSDDFFTGSRAALAGGTTTIIDFITPVRGESMMISFDKRMKEAEKSVCDYTFHMSPVEWTDNTYSEIIETIENYGITSFKTYMAYKDVVGISDDVLENVMSIVGDQGGIVTIHSELGDLIDSLKEKYVKEGKTDPMYHPLSRPPEAEYEAIKKVINISEKTGCPVYIVHVSAGKSVELIRNAQKEGIKVYAETCPHYLLLDDSLYNQNFNESARYVLSPPLRKKSDQQKLWQGIKDGTIQTIGTDHAPFNLSGQKDRGINDFTKIPNGAGSIEYRLSLLYTYGVQTNIISIERFVELTSTNPAKIFGLSDSKGLIKEGYDADIVIWDPEKESTISKEYQFQNCDSNIYEGFKLKGLPAVVIKGGKVVYEDGSLIKDLSQGKYLKRF
jgi:dihydropyrimidinase